MGPPISKRPYEYSHSNAINPYFWEDKGFKVKSIDLDSTYRQKKDSQLLYFARGIISENTLIKPYYDQSVQKIETVNEVVDLYISEFEKNNEIKILSYLNEDVYRWNAKIREQLFDIAYEDNAQDNRDYRINENAFSEKEEKMVLENEVLMVTENNRYHDTELLNGDNILINEIISKPYRGEVVESLPVKIFNKSGDATTEKFENFSLTFLDVKIKKVDATAYEKQDVTVKIILETLETQKLKNSHIRGQRTNIIEAYLREDFEIRNKAAIDRIVKESNIYDQEEKLQNLYENDPFLNALKVSYGYALTTHKAQGGEWEKIIADFESGLSHKDTFWAYTSITRAKDNIFIYKYPVTESSAKPLDYVSPFKGFMESLKNIFSTDKNSVKSPKKSSREKELELEIQRLQRELDKVNSSNTNKFNKPEIKQFKKNKFEGPTNDDGLLETELAYALKSWRLEKARNKGIAPFIILWNSHINSIAYFMPSSIEQLALIEGVGKAKVNEYGEEIINIVKAHIDGLEKND